MSPTSYQTALPRSRHDSISGRTADSKHRHDPSSGCSGADKGGVLGSGPHRGLIDAGWLFVIAGLAVCGAALLVPAQQDLDVARTQQAQLKVHSMASTRQLVAYDTVLRGLLDRDPLLMRRLAANHLNLLPEGETPILLDPAGAEGSFDQWVQDATRVEIEPDSVASDTLLARISSGPYRLLVIAGGILCLFVGTLYQNGSEKSPVGDQVEPD